MRRAGQLDRTITIRRFTEVFDGGGGSSLEWSDWKTVRAHLVQETTKEFMANYGADDEAVRVFRIRYLEGVTSSDSVRFDGRDFGIKDITVEGRNRGLELRCAEGVA